MTEQATPNRFTRRSVLARGAGALAAASGAGTLLAACGSSGSASGSGSAQASSKGTLEAWWWGDPPQMPAWLDTVAKKFKTEKGVSVSIDQQQTQSFLSNFVAAGAARQGPDVAAQWATLPVLAQAWKGYITPLNQLVPASELAHWSFRQENFYGGDYYAMPLYIIGSPFMMNKKLFAAADLDPNAPPKTWDEFLAICAKLKAKGILPFGMGDSDTFGGRFAFSYMGMQNLDSPEDLKAPLLGEASFADPKYSEWMGLFQELSQKGYFPSNAMSLDVAQFGNLFQAGKAAVSWTSDEIAITWGQALGNDNVEPIDFPVFGTGKLAHAYTATQSCSYFVTSWAGDPAVGAEFLKYLHEPAQLESLFKVCKVVPADDRFDMSQITDPLQQKLTQKTRTGPQIWLENYIPPSFDDNADGPGGQDLLTGSSVKTVAALWDKQAKAWREENPVSAQKYRAWQPQLVST
jgi:raffinose/stachyose/melibiose transport system substrate-binding protein